MGWFNVFKLYNLKILKKDKAVLLLTALSIFVSVLISILVPQITENIKEYMYNSIEEINGGDLMVQVQYPSNAFINELKSIEEEGYNITYEGLTSCYLKNDDNRKSIGKLIYNAANIQDDEIILSKTIATNINAKVNDEVEIESSKTGVKKYRVKEIENMPCGVDADSKALGYGKISYKVENNDIVKENSYLLFINGGDGERLKERLKNIEDGYVYTSLKDREKSVQSDVDREILAFSVVTTMAYLLSIITIITTTIMIILRRKKDFAILKMVSVPQRALKRAMFFEISLIILVPVILAGLCSFKLSSILLKANGYLELMSAASKVKIILKGLMFNCIVFILFLNITLTMLKSIKPLSIIREDQDESRKIKKKIIRRSMILMPILLFIYALYVGRLSAFNGGLLILLFIILFLGIISIIFKILGLVHFKNNVFIYGSQNIKKGYLSFIMIVLSITMTIVFLLVGFTLDKTIKESMNESMEDSLPYDHMVIEDGDNNLQNVFETDSSIDSYSKFYTTKGKIKNSNIKHKGITIYDSKEQEYGASYDILEGEDIFSGDKQGVLISNKYKKANKLNVGDYINVETLSGDFEYRIKGIYDGGEFNSQTILKQYDDAEHDGTSYLIKSKGDAWMNNVDDAYIVSVDTLSSSISSMLNKLFEVFRYLCFLCVFSSILFNVNIVYMNYMENRKDETIIEALGIGKVFCIKYQLFKLSVVIAMSTLMSFGIYSLVVKVALRLFLNSSTFISFKYFLIAVLMAGVLGIVSFSLPISKMRKKSEFEMLRE